LSHNTTKNVDQFTTAHHLWKLHTASTFVLVDNFERCFRWSAMKCYGWAQTLFGIPDSCHMNAEWFQIIMNSDQYDNIIINLWIPTVGMQSNDVQCMLRWKRLVISKVIRSLVVCISYMSPHIKYLHKCSHVFTYCHISSQFISIVHCLKFFMNLYDILVVTYLGIEWNVWNWEF
jgi:hypothetical protein